MFRQGIRISRTDTADSGFWIHSMVFEEGYDAHFREITNNAKATDRKSRYLNNRSIKPLCEYLPYLFHNNLYPWFPINDVLKFVIRYLKYSALPEQLYLGHYI